MTKTFVYQGRPCGISGERRIKSNKAARHSATYTAYVVCWLDTHTSELVPAGEFNGKALCAECGKRINLTGPKGCHCFDLPTPGLMEWEQVS